MINKTQIILISTILILSSGIASAYVPPDPVNLASTVNGGWVNFTWAMGSGGVTDSFNVSTSHNSGAWSWDNGTMLVPEGTPDMSSNNLVGTDGYAEIKVYAYNTGAEGNLSAGYVYDSVHAERSQFGEVIDLMRAIPDVIYPVLAIMVIVIIIRAYASVGRMIEGILEAITDMIGKGKGGK